MFKNIINFINKRRKKVKILDIKVYMDNEGTKTCDIDFNSGVIDKDKMTLDTIGRFVKSISKLEYM